MRRRIRSASVARQHAHFSELLLLVVIPGEGRQLARPGTSLRFAAASHSKARNRSLAFGNQAAQFDLRAASARSFARATSASNRVSMQSHKITITGHSRGHKPGM